MTRSQRWTLLVGSLLAVGFAVSHALAQPNRDRPANRRGSGSVVAVLDLAQIFEHHTRFKAMMAQLKADTARAEARMREQTEAVRKLVEELQKSSKDPESAEYKAAQEDVAKRGKDLQVRFQLQRKEFLTREAKIYHAVYEEILKIVEDYAQASKIDVVLRSQRTPIDADKPDQVLQHINRAIVWTDQKLDITPTILERLNQASGKSAPMAMKQAAPDKPATELVKSEASQPPKPKEPPAKREPSETANSKKAAGNGKPEIAEDEQKTAAAADGSEATSRALKKAGPDKPAEHANDEKKPNGAKHGPKLAEEKAKQAAAPKADPAREAAKPKTNTVVRLAIRGDYPEGPSAPGLFGDFRPSLATVVRRIDLAAEDDDVHAVLLRIGGASLGRGKLYELRAAIARLRKAGKPVYAELTSAGTSQYLLAAACDEIVMVPVGTLTIPGVRAEAMFFKGLLDKLGIQFDVLQMGKYKGAAESFTRTDMSPPLRESLEALLDDTYEHLVATIAQDRKLEAAQVKTLIDRGVFTADAAAKAGLVDRVVYPDEFRQTLREKLGADAVNLVDDYRKKKPDADFSGLGGMMKLMQMMFGDKPSAPTSKKEKIAVIYAAGMILSGKSTTSIFGEQVVGSATLVEALQAAAEDPKVLAIVLRVDSPGGSALAADMIWREVVKIKKPIIASMGDVAGSGGYYIAMGADKILAAPDTITGSIGVVGGKFVLGGLYDKIGITTEVISRGKNSGAFSSTRPFTPEEREAWMAVMKEIYSQFVAKAAQSRKMPGENLETLAQGRVYSGRMAAANGLVDGLGTLTDAIAEAKKAAGLKPDQEVELLILPRPRTIFEQLFQDPSASARLETIAPQLGTTLSSVELLRRLFSEPALTLMPCRLELK